MPYAYTQFSLGDPPLNTEHCHARMMKGDQCPRKPVTQPDERGHVWCTVHSPEYEALFRQRMTRYHAEKLKSRSQFVSSAILFFHRMLDSKHLDAKTRDTIESMLELVE